MTNLDSVNKSFLNYSCYEIWTLIINEHNHTIHSSKKHALSFHSRWTKFRVCQKQLLVPPIIRIVLRLNSFLHQFGRTHGKEILLSRWYLYLTAKWLKAYFDVVCSSFQQQYNPCITVPRIKIKKIEIFCFSISRYTFLSHKALICSIAYTEMSFSLGLLSIYVGDHHSSTDQKNGSRNWIRGQFETLTESKSLFSSSVRFNLRWRQPGFMFILSNFCFCSLPI